MLRNLNQSSAGKRILGIPQVGILAAQIASETAIGDSGPGLLYPESQLAEYAGKYLRGLVTSWPATGTLMVYEDGSFIASGIPDGDYTLAKDLYVDGVYDSSANIYVHVGASSVQISATTANSIFSGGATSTSPGAGTITDADIVRICDALMARLQVAPIPVNIKQVNSVTIKGSGTSGDTWGPA